MRLVSLSILLLSLSLFVIAYAHPKQTGIIAATVANPNLKYFGYYKVDDADTPANQWKDYLPDIVAMGNSNIAMIHWHWGTDFQSTQMRSFLQQARNNHIQVIIDADAVWHGNADTIPSLSSLFPTWQTRWELMKKAVAGYEDVVYAFYYDEPSGLDKATFRIMTQQMRIDRPQIGQMVIENPTHINSATSDYYDFLTDMGFDYYLSPPGSPVYDQLYTQMESVLATHGQKIWLVPNGFGQTPQDSLTTLDTYDAFAKAHPRVVGLMPFLYSPHAGFSCTVRQMVIPGESCYSAGYRAESIRIGQEIILSPCLPATPPVTITPNTTTSAGTQTVSWSGDTQATFYWLRIDDLSNPWTGTCNVINPGDVCTDSGTNSYQYTFQTGHSYRIWVHSGNRCSISAPTVIAVNATEPIPTQLPTPTPTQMPIPTVNPINPLPPSRINPGTIVSGTPAPLPPARTNPTITPVPPTATPTPTPTIAPEKRLGSMDLDGYCRAIGQRGAVLVNNAWTCVPSNTIITLDTACVWQYGAGAFVKQERTNDPYSYACYNHGEIIPTPTPTKAPQIRLGGMDLDGYCKSTGQIGAVLVNTVWNCTPSNSVINLNAVCQSQYKIPTALAKQERPNDPLSYACYSN